MKIEIYQHNDDKKINKYNDEKDDEKQNNKQDDKKKTIKMMMRNKIWKTDKFGVNHNFIYNLN